MSHWPMIDDKPYNPPISFYDRILEDIPPETWTGILKENPILKKAVLEGFSGKAKKLPGVLAQPETKERLSRVFQSDTAAFQQLLEIWGEEMAHLVLLLHMFDGSFILDYWRHLRNLYGPERFFACLCLCGDFEHQAVCDLLNPEQEFWTRKADVHSLALLGPALAVIKDYADEYPELSEYVFGPESPFEEVDEVDDPFEDGDGPDPFAEPDEQYVYTLEKDLAEAENKLHKAEKKQAKLHDKLERAESKNKELKKKLKELEKQSKP